MKQDLTKLIKLLLKEDFDFVLIGGFAASAYGSSMVTQDLDICMLLTAESIQKLRKLFENLHPFHRQTPQRISFFDFTDQAQDLNNLYLQTDLGILDIVSTVSGVGDFNRVKEKALEVPLFGHKCKLISIDDLIKCKLTLKRPKDLACAQELEIIKTKK